MFNWFWEFLYGITKSIFHLIDGIMECANKLCGIDSININGKSTDLLTYLVSSDQTAFAFRVAVILGFIVLIFFTIFAILRSIAKERVDQSPGQICVKAAKSLLMFFFVPMVMLIFVWVFNAFLKAMYQATLSGTNSIGSFLFTAFAQDAGLSEVTKESFLNGTLSYLDTATVENNITLSNFDFFSSWLAGCLLLFTLGWALVVCVDRAISIVMLFIASPFSIASSVLDDGERFKLWRNEVLNKFFIGFGVIVGINIYCMVVSLVIRNSVVFFDNTFLNDLIKIIIIIGGGLSLKKSMALVGNLVSAGAGSGEFRDQAINRSAILHGAMAGVKLVGGTAKLAGKGINLLRGGSKSDSSKKNGESKDSNASQKDSKENSGNYQGFNGGNDLNKNKNENGKNGISNVLNNSKSNPSDKNNQSNANNQNPIDNKSNDANKDIKNAMENKNDKGNVNSGLQDIK
jgi:hypothetical protein